MTIVWILAALIVVGLLVLIVRETRAGRKAMDRADLRDATQYFSRVRTGQPYTFRTEADTSWLRELPAAPRLNIPAQRKELS